MVDKQAMAGVIKKGAASGAPTCRQNGAAQKNLPEGWEWKTLGEIADINPRIDKSKIADNLQVSFVPMPAVGAGDGQIDVSQLRPAREVKKGYTPFEEGDVLFAKITPCMENGKMAVVPKLNNGVGFGSTEFHVLRPRHDVAARYLYHYVSNASFRKEAAHSMTGAVGQKRVHTAYLSACPIPRAPLDHQKLIVAEIEKQFSRLDEAVAGLKRIKANLKRYKAAVLKAAVEGKLTEEWRKEHPDIEPASQLLKSILAARKQKWEEKNPGKKYKEPAAPDTSNLPELPKGWVWATIDQVAECLDSMRVPINKKERASREGTVPYYGANGQVGWIDDYIYNEPLVLVVEDETFTGRELPFCYKISGKSWVNNHAHVLRNTKAVGIDYLNYSLAHYPFTRLTTGTTGRKKLTQAALLSAPYPLAPIAEQMEIVSQVESSLSVTEESEAAVETNLKRADRLRRAILEKAFSGRLKVLRPYHSEEEDSKRVNGIK